MESPLDEQIRIGKYWVEQGYLSNFQDALDSMDLLEADWPVLFHRLYLHACLKKKKEIANWMETTWFPRLDPIQQIGLRQIFAYGRVLKK